MLTKQNNIFTAFLRDVFLGWTTKEAIYAWTRKCAINISDD